MTLPPLSLRARVIAALAWGALCFVIGHGTRKTIEVEHVREVQVQAQQQVAAAKSETARAKTDAAAAKTRTVVHTVYVHGEPTEVTKEVVREVERHHEEQAARVVTKTVVQERVVYRDRDVVRAVAATGPRWSVAARAGLNLDGRAQYGAELGRRVLGGLWITAGADVPNRAALVGVRLEF